MLIYIVRHAWAGEHGDPRWPDDRLRPLTEEGRERFANVAKELAQRGCEPQIIATSPLVRCRETAEILAAQAPGKPRIVPLDALRPGSNLAALLAWSRDQQADQIAWVGHAPDVSLLAAELVGDCQAAIRFSKGACAAISFDEGLQPGAGELRWHATAKLLGC